MRPFEYPRPALRRIRFEYPRPALRRIRFEYPRPALRRIRGIVLAVALASSACVTVRPQQRGVLSDAIMRFGGNEHDGVERAHLRHAIDNREGAFGAEGVSGGGCGCN